jgi:hypothetical protein
MTARPKDASASASADPAPGSSADASPGDMLGGLRGLLKQFQQNGFGDAINSWTSTGPNKTVTADQVSSALDPEIIDALSQRMGLPKVVASSPEHGRQTYARSTFANEPGNGPFNSLTTAIGRQSNHRTRHTPTLDYSPPAARSISVGKEGIPHAESHCSSLAAARPYCR